MAYPTDAPAYPECGPRSTLQDDPKSMPRPLISAMDDMHHELELLRAETDDLLKHLDPVLSAALPEATSGGSSPTVGSKITTGIHAASRKAGHIRDLIAQIRNRLDF